MGLANALMLDAIDFKQRWEEQGRKGETEHAIYYDAGAARWFKLNNLTNHGNWLEYFHRLALHNWLFPEAPLEFEGLTEFDADLLPVMSQPHIAASRGASAWEIDQLMHGLGFQSIRYTDPTRQYDFINRSIGVEVNDLHDENVLVAATGEVVVIDPVPMMEQESKMRRLAVNNE
jgi:hypothetical protein